MLKRIYADNYRCLVNFELRPQAVNLLVGDNGSGKSAVFQILEAIQDIVVHGTDVAETVPTSTLTRWDTRDVQRFEIDLDGEDGTFQYALDIEHNLKTSAAVIRREQVKLGETILFRYEARTVNLYNNQGKLGASFPADPRRSFLAIIEERPENEQLMRFKRLVQTLWIFHLNPSRMVAVSKKEGGWLERDGSNLASWYRAVSPEDPVATDALKADMREIIDGFQHLRLVSNGGAAKELVASVTASTSDPRKPYDLSLEELSSGQRQLIALYAILHFAAPRATALCFDEPDNFIALREIQPWLLKLSDVVQQTGGQLFVISHHPEVIDYLASGNAFKFERPGGDVVRARPLVVNLDAGLKASEALARGRDDGQG